jgi:hypothetical protein
MNYIYFSGIFSLVIQVITGIIGLYSIKLPIPPSYYLINELVIFEIIVQVLEAIFYIWMISQFSTIKNITPFRYYDWALTTPTMLTTFIFYLMFLRDRENDVVSKPFMSELKENWQFIVKVAILDWLMLLSGYLGEQRIFSFVSTTIVGFIPFFLMFYLIYVNFASYSKTGRTIFWYFSIVWAIYGVAAVFPYHIKNTMYNILDIFSKNFFGLFLSYVLYKASKLV